MIVQEIDAVDRNADGDFFDAFVALVRPGAPVALSEFPVSIGTPLAFAGGELAYFVGEFFAGDLNGDSDLDDGFLFTMDVVTGISTNLLLDALTLTSAGDHFLFLRHEGVGGADWTGDGDMNDVVVWVRDAVSGDVHGTGLAHLAGATLDPASSASSLLLQVPESEQNSDLTGDGDLFDLAWVRHDFASRLNQNLGAGGLAEAALLDDGRGALFVRENGQDFAGADGQDLNGDGDFDDFVLHELRAP